jgi:hypothetical protein
VHPELGVGSSDVSNVGGLINLHAGVVIGSRDRAVLRRFASPIASPLLALLPGDRGSAEGEATATRRPDGP